MKKESKATLERRLRKENLKLYREIDRLEEEFEAKRRVLWDRQDEIRSYFHPHNPNDPGITAEDVCASMKKRSKQLKDNVLNNIPHPLLKFLNKEKETKC